MRHEFSKIYFRLQQDEDGYPPAAVESMWAKPRGNGYIIDGIPFFTTEATNGDEVVAQKGEGDLLWFDEIVRTSGNSLIRIVMFDVASREAVVKRLLDLGCATEQMDEFSLVAVNVPPMVPLLGVQLYLQDRSARGILDYEEPILRQ